MRKLLLATAGLLLLAAPALADESCVTKDEVAAALAKQDPKISLSTSHPSASILHKVQNVFGPAPHAANDKVAALILYDGQPAGVVFFDEKGCAADSILPGIGLMEQVLAQP